MKKRNRPIKPKEPTTTAESIKIFLQTAKLDLMSAVQTVCKKRFPQTVKVFDELSESELTEIRSGGLLSLPKPKVSELRQAMQTDNFQWLV